MESLLKSKIVLERKTTIIVYDKVRMYEEIMMNDDNVTVTGNA